MHGIQDGGDHVFVAHRRVDHEVIQRTVGPVSVEIVFHVGDTLAINRFHQFFGLGLALTELPQPPDLFRRWRIGKNMESVSAIAQEVRRPAAHNDGLAFLGDLFHNLLHH